MAEERDLLGRHGDHGYEGGENSAYGREPGGSGTGHGTSWES